MNDLRGGCGRRIRLSHLRRFYETETTRPFLGTRTTTTTLTYRNFRTSAAKMTNKQEKWTAPVVRKTFLEFFEGKGHIVGTWRGRFFGAEQNIFIRFQLLGQAQWELKEMIFFLYLVVLRVFS